MDIYEKVKQKYKRRKIFSISIIVAGTLAFALTILFIFINKDGAVPFWNQYHYWATGLSAVLITAGAILLVSCISALKDIEKTVNRLNPDEREQAILDKANVKTLKIYIWIIYPVIFVVASILLMLEYINFIAWILLIISFIAILITTAIVRRKEYDKF